MIILTLRRDKKYHLKILIILHGAPLTGSLSIQNKITTKTQNQGNYISQLILPVASAIYSKKVLGRMAPPLLLHDDEKLPYSSVTF
jgi:hypothetical protein